MEKKRIVFPSLESAIGVAILGGLGAAFFMFVTAYLGYMFIYSTSSPPKWVTTYLLATFAGGLMLGGVYSVSYWRRHKKDRNPP